MSLLYRLLTHRVAKTYSQTRAERSRFVWRAIPTAYPDAPHAGWELRVIGAINGVMPRDVRLTLVIEGKDS